MRELIDKSEAIEAMNTKLEEIKLKWRGKVKKGEIAMYLDMRGVIETLPSAQPEDWMERNKDRILQAGKEGREVEFRIGGRLFAIREKAQ